MIRSMTGFGRAEVTAETCVVSVEARSVNHRHLDLVLRLPLSLAGLELEARRLVQSRLERGHVEITVQIARGEGHPAPTVKIDTALARRYVERARELARDVGLDGDATLPWLLEQPGVMGVEEEQTLDATTAWPTLEQALTAALDALVARRASEGALLVAELRALGAELEAELQSMAARAPLAAARRQQRFRERLEALLDGAPVDESRILTEVAVWAQKTDITEELARLRAHLGEFTLMLDKDGPVGRSFDFLIQELNREVNTVASKADDLELSHAAIAAKGILEKIREQVQNLE